MAVKIAAYLRPATLREATTLLAEGGRTTVAVGGGVALMLSGAPRAVHAVDLSQLGLDRIERKEAAKDATLRIGALVTLQTLIRHPEAARAWGGLLPEACRTAATKPLREVVTVGGNVAQCYYWSTLPPLLMALDGRIVLAGPEKSRSVAAADFFATHPKKTLGPGELVKRIEIPLPPEPSPLAVEGGEIGRWGAAYAKFARTVNEYALVNACAVVGATGDGRLGAVRLVLGALDGLPHRLSEAEAALTGRPFEEARARAVLESALRSTPVRSDFRASVEYRRHTAATVLRRTLATAWDRATRAVAI